MKLLLMYDGVVGNSIAEWLLNNYSEDICALVVTEETARLDVFQQKEIKCLKFQTEVQLLNDLREFPSFDLGILAWWPKIVSSKILELAKSGFINTHPSLLPYNRGKHYNFWALVEQAPFGVSLHFVDEGIDSGDIVAQSTIPYDWEDTGESLYCKATDAMIELFKLTYPTLRSGFIERVPQNLNEGTLHYSKEIDLASHIHLDKNYSARHLINLLRARTFAGHPACYFEDNGEEYEIKISIDRKHK
jgi:methionyl-tRNA formyltransferase